MIDSAQLLDGLNEQQRQAVTCPLGPTLVLAGPGSGKTRVLTHRIAYLIHHYGTDPHSILAVTFTNKAAREMRNRLDRMLGVEADGVTLGTFHSVCARILRREAERFGISRDFIIYDQDDQIALMKSVLEELNADDKKYRPAAVLAAVSRAKSEMLTPQTYQPPTYWHEMVARAYERYQKKLTNNNALDFDDLLLTTVWGLQQDEGILKRYRARYRHVLVDEFQDTNMPQYEFIRLLTSPDGCVFAVGDEDQSIYGWRGADYRNLERLRDTFSGLRTYLLEKNYRSTQTILDAAKAIIARNLKRVSKDLQAAHGSGELVRVLEAYSSDEEAGFVVSEIERLMASGQYHLADFAVMYRMNAQSRALEEAFIRHHLPYRLIGGTRFYERREVKDILAYLRLIAATNDWVSFERVANVPPRGLGAVSLAALRKIGVETSSGPYDTLRALRDHGHIGGELSRRSLNVAVSFLETWESLLELSRQGTVADLIDGILALFGYGRYLAESGPEGQERLENVQELRTVAAEHFVEPGRESLTRFLDEVALVADTDDLDETVEAPLLMTLHTAKGLEFPVVFIVGMQEGVLPHSRSLDEPEQLEEERRLCYVGITRAMHRLYLLYSLSGRYYGEVSRNMPSRFLKDLPPDVLYHDKGRSRRTETKRPSAGDTQLEHPLAAESRSPQSEKQIEVVQYQPGEMVVHPQFGRGMVVDYRLARGDAEVAVAFEKKGVKRLLASLANLQKA